MKKITRGFVSSFDEQLLYSEMYENTQHPRFSLVLLHGMGGDLNFIRPFVDHLLKKYQSLRCIIYDSRGHGLSANSFPGQLPQMEDVSARDLQAVCHHYRLDQPIIVGHSFGGMAVQHYVNLQLSPHPEHLFLLNAPLSTPQIGINRQFWFKQLQNSHSKVAATRSVTAHLRFSQSHDLDPIRIFYDLKTTGFNQWLLLYLSTLGWRNPSPQKINHQRTTVILGKKDFLLRHKTQQSIFSALDQAHHYLLNTNHHQAYLVAKEQLGQIIADRLRLTASQPKS